METIEAAIEKFLCTLDSQLAQIPWDRPLLEDGLVVSIHILPIVNFLEGKFAITIDPFEIDPKSFETIHNLAELVRSKGGKCTA